MDSPPFRDGWSRWPAFAVALVMALAATPASGQTLRGLLLERDTDRPVSQGSIAMLDARGDTVASAISDENGLFSVTGPDGGFYRLVARALGYRPEGVGPYEVDDGGLMVVQVSLEPQPVPIEGIDVEGEAALFETPYLARQGFYERQRSAIGHFMDPMFLAEEVPLVTYTGELFYRIPGTFVTADGRHVLMRGATGGRCSPAVFIDGARMRGRLDDVAPTEILEAVEVYTRPARTPLQYAWANQGCGVIVIWTKH